jgi:hypothetical protein
MRRSKAAASRAQSKTRPRCSNRRHHFRGLGWSDPCPNPKSRPLGQRNSAAGNQFHCSKRHSSNVGIALVTTSHATALDERVLVDIRSSKPRVDSGRVH